MPNAHNHSSVLTREALVRHLNARDLVIIEELMFLSIRQAQKSPSKARYCTPSLLYLSKKAGINVYNTSRHISKLVRLGVIRRTHRRDKAGKRQTNMYIVTDFRALRYAKRARQAICSSIPQHSTAICSLKQMDYREKSSNINGLDDNHLRASHLPIRANIASLLRKEMIAREDAYSINPRARYQQKNLTKKAKTVINKQEQQTLDDASWYTPGMLQRMTLKAIKKPKHEGISPPPQPVAHQHQ